jgi:uncharacterized protein
MFDDSPEVQTSDLLNQPVTAVLSQLVKPGREQGYEEWLKGISAAAKAFDGHCGVSIIRPQDRARPEYVVILRFDRYSKLKAWMESDIRKEWIERSLPLVEKPQDVQVLTGLETWFTLPEKPLKAPPPRYKMALVTWLGVFCTLVLVSHLLSPITSNIPHILSQLITTGIVVACLTYFVMPNLTRLFYKWLHPSS